MVITDQVAMLSQNESLTFFLFARLVHGKDFKMWESYPKLLNLAKFVPFGAIWYLLFDIRTVLNSRA